MNPEERRILNFIASIRGGHSAIDKTQLKNIMLATGGQTFSMGQLCDIKAKHLGAGVYRISLERKP